MTAKKPRIISTVGIWLVTGFILMFGGFKLDWPWDALWTNPAAIRWMEVLKVCGLLAAANFVTVAIWWRGSSGAKGKKDENHKDPEA